MSNAYKVEEWTYMQASSAKQINEYIYFYMS